MGAPDKDSGVTSRFLFFLRQWFVVHGKCACEHAFPENVIASALRHGEKYQNKLIN